MITFRHNHQIYLDVYLNSGPTCLTRFGRNHVPARCASSGQLFSHHCLKRTLFQITVPSISEKRNWSLCHHEAIRRKHPDVLSDGVILPHDNTHAVPKTQELLQKSNKEVQGPIREV
ncbi:hypothetical protein AVEN_129915-1 [Araneus ventricosus]|uniref:Uncharacterized protein n=1 Tax=Araneus ventricosus TaxID=182803 RepID=A0A4Y2QM32_ARAVE|nr:hypothetical protein AVEN_129915-1 [Araneus ventricosus]